MLHEPIVLGCAGSALLPELHVTAWSRVSDSAAGVGWLNARLAGFIAFVDCASATSAAPTFTRLSFRLRARSSVGVMYRFWERQNVFLQLRERCWMQIGQQSSLYMGRTLAHAKLYR
jgi:hypothetical protein